MVNQKLTLFIIFIFISFSIQAQFSDLARVDMTFLPRGNSEIEYNRLGALFNYPIALNKEGSYVSIGLAYSHINLKMDSVSTFDKSKLDSFQLLDLAIAYTSLISDDWRLAVKFSPGFSSNLDAKKLNFEDAVLSGDVVFIKDKSKDTTLEKPYRLMVGVFYSGNRGLNFPLPFISYYRKFKPKWSFNLGIPKSNLQYHISETHRLKAYAELDGFTSNLQNGLTVVKDPETTKTARQINMTLILGGFEYEYHFAKHLLFFARTSYIFSNSVKLKSKNKTILNLDNSNTVYLRTGIRLKL